MASGIQVFDSSGNISFDTPDRLGRLIYVGTCAGSGVANATWTQVINPSYSTSLWGVMIPNYSVDTVPSNELYIKNGNVAVDPVNHPGCIYISGYWYDSNTGTLTTYPYDNCTLVYGIY